MRVVVTERVKCLTKEQSRSLQKYICLCHLLANSTSVAKPINWYRNIRKLHKKSHCNTFCHHHHHHELPRGIHPHLGAYLKKRQDRRRRSMNFIANTLNSSSPISFGGKFHWKLNNIHQSQSIFVECWRFVQDQNPHLCWEKVSAR